ncbi:MAG: hypothetical protein AAGK32_05125 [Actinomycetota bacterium]
MPLLTDAPSPTLPSMTTVEDHMATPTPRPRPGAYPASTHVEVRNNFDGAWAKGFEVAEVTELGYRIRRSSDGAVLPAEFTPDQVRKERSRSSWWV